MVSRAIITGANGYIGSALARSVVDRGDHVTAVVRHHADCSSLADIAGIEIVECDLHDYENLADKIKRHESGVFYHLAWDGKTGAQAADPSRQLANTKASVDAVTAAAQLGCQRFVMVGSINEYEVLALTENTPSQAQDGDQAQASSQAQTGSQKQLRGTLVYGAAKLAAEQMGKVIAQQAGISFHAARLAMIYGADNPSRMVPNVVVSQLIAGVTPALVAGDGRYDLVHISDVVAALIAIAQRGIDQRSYYVGHREPTTFRQIMEDMRDIVEPTARLNFGAYPGDTGIDYSMIDTGLLEADTGFSCSADFASTVTQMADSLRRNQRWREFA